MSNTTGMSTGKWRKMSMNVNFLTEKLNDPENKLFTQ